jgi:FHS family glucose/mannose:H+ symporter-like MFS transporter
MYKRAPVFFAACFGMLLFGITLITLGSVATDLKLKYALDGIAAGTLFSILPLGILAGSFLFGPVCDNYGYKVLMILTCLVMFAGFQGIAFASSLGVLKGCIFIFGVGGGVINGATNALVSDISARNKGANLSLLGVFFCIGALGMPLLLGLLSGKFNAFQVISGVGWLTLLVGIAYLFVQFPPAKRQPGMELNGWKQLITPLLLFISLFLFFQSSLEAIVNNWATTFLTSRTGMSENYARYALSLHIGGMTIMRLLTGSVLRNLTPSLTVSACLFLLLTGFIFLQLATTPFPAIVGLVLTGAGLAEGFPIMLGYAGERFPGLSATAFSMVFVVALIGNMLINYLMGIIVHTFGVEQLTMVSFIETAIMIGIFIIITRQLKK